MFRFTIRDLIWLTVVVAMGAGWWTHLRFEKEVMARQVRAMDSELQKAMARQERVYKRMNEMRDKVIELHPEAANTIPILPGP